MFLAKPHQPIEKRLARQEIEAKYLAWRLSGGQTTVIKKEHLRLHKRGRFGEKLDSEKTRKPPMRFEVGA